MNTMTASDRKSSAVSRLTHSVFLLPALALFTALVLGGLVIWITSGSITTVLDAYWGLLRGAFFKERGLSESLVATVPYVFLSLAVAVGFKAGLFNIGVEGQFYIGAVSAVFVGQLTNALPAIIHLPLTMLAGAMGGAIWAAIPGYLKARTGAHEVITTIMFNYIAFRFTELMVSGPLRDVQSTAVQTTRVAPSAEIWLLSDIPARLLDPLNAIAVALAAGLIAFLAAQTIRRRNESHAQSAPMVLSVGRAKPHRGPTIFARHSSLVSAVAVIIATATLLPLLARFWWPFNDQYDRLHIGIFFAVAAAVGAWWLLWKTTIGYELRTVGANPNAARYAGMSITRTVVMAMAISGALAGFAGTIEVLGVSICRCLPLFFSSGYGFDSIAISLLANNSPIGILGVAFLFGAMRNGADLMELSSGVSKYIISLIQALILLFVSAPPIIRWLFRIRAVGTGQGLGIPNSWGGKT